ncbi:hypothetical protein ABIB26_000938 [Arthrobacter sp. UYEF20]
MGEEPVDEAEVPAGDARYRCDGLRVGEILGIQRVPEFLPSAFQDEMQFFLGEWTVFMGESDPAVELGVTAEPFSMPGIPMRIRAVLFRS